MSRRTVSHNSVFQAHANRAPARVLHRSLVSTSTSAMRTPSSFACLATQSVVTSVPDWHTRPLGNLLSKIYRNYIGILEMPAAKRRATMNRHACTRAGAFYRILRQGFDPRLAAALWASFQLAFYFRNRPWTQARSRARRSTFAGAELSRVCRARVATAKANMNEQAFGKLGAQIKGWGAIDKIGEPVSRKWVQTKVVTIPVSFADKNIKARFAINVSGRFGYVPDARRSAVGAPGLQQAGPFTERDVTFGDE